MVAGKTGGETIRFEAGSILSARYLPRRTGQEFAPELLESTAAIALSHRLCSLMRTWLEASALENGANAGFSHNGYLQLTVSIDAKDVVLPPWVVGGGERYIAPILGSTDVLYDLAGPLQDSLRAFVAQASCSDLPTGRGETLRLHLAQTPRSRH